MIFRRRCDHVCLRPIYGDERMHRNALYACFACNKTFDYLRDDQYVFAYDKLPTTWELI